MATAIGKALLTGTLKSVGKALGLSILNDLTGDAFDKSKEMLEKIQQGVDKNAAAISELRAQIKEVLVKLDDLDAKMSNLKNGIDDGFFGIGLQIVQNSVDRVNAMYEMYTSAVKALGSEKVEKSPGSYRARLRELGEQIASSSGIYADLKQIHSGLTLGDSSLVIQAQNKNLKDDRDVIAQAIRLKAFMYNYLIVQVRGITLMTWANADPDVPFQDADDDIARIWQNIEDQSDYFTTVFGKRLDDFTQQFFENPSEEVKIHFISDKGGYEWKHGFEPAYIADTGDYPVYYEDYTRYWTAKLAQPVEADSFDADGEYTFIWKACSQADSHPDASLMLDGGYANYDVSDSTWKVIPISGDRVKMQCKTSKRWGSDRFMHLVGAAMLGQEDSYNPDDPSFNFQIALLEDMPVIRNLNPKDEPLPAGVRLLSKNENWQLELSPETGHVLLTDLSTGEVVWQIDSGVNGEEPDSEGSIVMEAGGDFTAVRKDGSIWYSSNTTKPEDAKGYNFVLDDAGQPMVIGMVGWSYETLWAPRGGLFNPGIA